MSACLPTAMAPISLRPRQFAEPSVAQALALAASFTDGPQQQATLESAWYQLPPADDGHPLVVVTAAGTIAGNSVANNHTDGQAVELGGYLRKAAQLMGAPVEIEWALGDDGIQPGGDHPQPVDPHRVGGGGYERRRVGDPNAIRRTPNRERGQRVDDVRIHDHGIDVDRRAIRELRIGADVEGHGREVIGDLPLGGEAGLRFAIVRPFNFFGPRMDYLPGIEGEGKPRVLAMFVGAVLNDDPILLVDGGHAFVTCFVEEDVPDWAENPSGYGPLEWKGRLHCTRFARQHFERLVDGAGLAVDRFEYGRETDGQSLYVLRTR